MSVNSVQSFVIENCNGPTIENGLNNVCLHSLSRTFTTYSTYDKDALNRPILRFNIFFVSTRAMWVPHTIFILLVMGGPCKFFEK